MVSPSRIKGLTVGRFTLVAALLALAGGLIAGHSRPPSTGRAPAELRVAAAGIHASPGMMAAGFLGAPIGAGVESASGFNGVADFVNAGSYPFTVPQGITTVLVQLYGAGGGGAGGSKNHAGGGGGGGAYAMSVVAVTAGATYTINVGAGGAGGIQKEPGEDGGDTQFLDPNGNVIVAAGGGGGGQPSGQGGNAGQPVGNPMIGHVGPIGLGGGVGQSPGYTLSTFPAGSHQVVGTGGRGGGTFYPFAGGLGVPGYAFIAY
jgi:Glycine-rich domain